MRWVGGDLPEIVADLLDSRVIATAHVHASDWGTALTVRLESGTTVFVKTQSVAIPGMYETEAAGLRWLGETNTVRVPKVLAVRDDPELAHRFLVLEHVAPAAPAPDHDEQLGRALAALHRFPCAGFGWERDNFVGALAQDNTPEPTWPDFYARRRLEPLVRRGVDQGLLPADAGVRFEALARRLPDLVGPPEPPARLHGDLWRGNVIADARGAPALVDPSVYGGHREVDLAMMQLFGCFDRRTFAAYDEAHPRATGHEDRVDLYQLYPLLVHLHLFGASYAAGVLRTLGRYA